MPYTRLVALTLAITTLTVAGCGGSNSNKPSQKASAQTGASNVAETQPSTPTPRRTKPLARTELIKRGDAICRQLNQRLRSPSLRDNSLYTVGVTSVPTVSYYRAAFTELRSLTPPVAMANAWKTIVADVDKASGEIATMGRFALDNDSASTVRVEIKLGQTQRHRFTIARHNGFTDCGE